MGLKGDIYYKKGVLLEALNCFFHQHILEPYKIKPLVKIGDMYLELKQKKRAMEYYMKAKDLFNKLCEGNMNPVTRRLICNPDMAYRIQEAGQYLFFSLARIFLQMGNIEKAKFYFSKGKLKVILRNTRYCRKYIQQYKEFQKIQGLWQGLPYSVDGFIIRK